MADTKTDEKDRLLQEAEEARARAEARLAELEAQLEASGVPTFTLPAKPKQVKDRDGTKLGVPGDWITLDDVQVSKKRGLGGTNKTVVIPEGTWLPKDFPGDLLSALLAQKPCPVQQIRRASDYKGPLPSRWVRAPEVPQKVRGKYAPRKGHPEDEGEAFRHTSVSL